MNRVTISLLLLWALLVGAFFYCDRTIKAPNLEASVVMVSNATGHGTGVYIGNGQVITAAHVVKEAGVDGKMVIKLGDKSVPATVVWYDEDADVGLLKLDMPMLNLHAAWLACSMPDVVVGDELEAIGDPLGFVDLHTWGHVALGVQKRTDNGKDQINLIADLTIAPGNSGGPVFTRSGRVAGITVALSSTMIMGMYPALFALTYIIPTSVICSELAAPHDAPKFNKGNS